VEISNRYELLEGRTSDNISNTNQGLTKSAEIVRPKKGKLSWVWNPSQIQGDNLKNVRHETSGSV
jgi:hypothetical protein